MNHNNLDFMARKKVIHVRGVRCHKGNVALRTEIKKTSITFWILGLQCTNFAELGDSTSSTCFKVENF